MAALITDGEMAALERQDPYHPEGPGRELPADEAKVLVHWFCGNWDWWAVSASRDETGDVQFFGLVSGQEVELGYFWLSQLVEAEALAVMRYPGSAGQVSFMVHAERDEHWQACTLAELYHRTGHCLRHDYPAARPGGTPGGTC